MTNLTDYPTSEMFRLALSVADAERDEGRQMRADLVAATAVRMRVAEAALERLERNVRNAAESTGEPEVLDALTFLDSATAVGKRWQGSIDAVWAEVNPRENAR